MKKTILIFCLILASCSKSTLYFTELSYFTGIEKLDILWDQGESTPIVWQGDLIYVSVGYSNPYTIQIRDSKGSVMHSYPANLEYISAYNDNGTLYVIGAKAGAKEALMILSTQDLINWTPQRMVIGEANTQYFNSSITKTDNGFVLAYELCRPDFLCFNAQFLHTTDFVTWTSIGTRIFDKSYTACPTIRYVEGYYYVLFLAHFPYTLEREEYWATHIARSKDLWTWEHGKKQVLTPLDGLEGAPNASDIDFVEHNGLLEIIYLNTPQITRKPYYENIGSRRAVYKGTLKQFLQAQF